MNRNNVNNQNTRSPLGQAWYVGTYPFRMLGRLGLPLFVIASKVKGVGGADSRSYRIGDKLYTDDGKVIRQGGFFEDTRNYHNPHNIINHPDVLKFEFNLNESGGYPRINCFPDQNRYDICSKLLYCADIANPKPNLIPTMYDNTICIKMVEKDKKQIIDGVKKKLSSGLKCASNKNQKPDIVAFEFLMHRNQDGKYGVVNIKPQDFSELFEQAMQSYKKMYVTEGSCFNSKDMIETLTNLAKKNKYCGDIVVRRNSKYDKGFDFTHEYSDWQATKANRIWHMPEFVHIKDGKINCISEDQAREILGGSYLKNKEYNEGHELGDDVPNKNKCTKFMKQCQYKGQCDKANNKEPLMDTNTHNGKDNQGIGDL